MKITSFFYVRWLSAIRSSSLRVFFLKSSTAILFILAQLSAQAQVAAPVNVLNNDAEEIWIDDIQGPGPWVAILGKKFTRERENGLAYIGVQAGNRGMYVAQGIQPEPDFISFSVEALNIERTAGTLTVTFTEQVNDKKQDIDYYRCADLSELYERRLGSDRSATINHEVYLAASGRLATRNDRVSGDPLNTRIHTVSSKTKEDLIAQIRNYLDKVNETNTIEVDPTFACGGEFPKGAYISTDEAEVVQIVSFNNSSCDPVLPACSGGDESVRFRFGVGSFACANPVEPITAASYVVLSDGSTYELNLWSRDGVNQGSYCVRGSEVPEVEVPRSNPYGGEPIYQPIPVLPTPDSPSDPSGKCTNIDICPILGVTLTSEVEVWNADDPFNFYEQMTLKGLDGRVIDGACVYWYAERRLHDKDGNGRRESKAVAVEEEEAYYFGAEPNLDQWGAIDITAVYYCNGQFYSDMVTIEVIDAGIYFRNANGDILRWHKDVYERDPSRYQGFYDPSKKTMLFSHGWSPGGTMTHTKDPVNDPVRKRQTDTGIDNWHNQGWNVMLFFWTQYASTRAGVDPALIDSDLLENNADEVDASPFFASVHASRANPRWFRTYPEVEVTREAATNDPMGVVAGKQFKEILDNLGGDPSKEIRFVGHSFGHTVITKATEWLHKNSSYRVDRMAWLDPAMDVEGLALHEAFTVADPSAPIIEWYQTSTYDLAFQVMINQMYDNRIIESPTLGEGVGYFWIEIVGGTIDGIIGAVETLIGVPLAYADLNSYAFVTSNTDVSFYNELIVNTTYIRLHPLWQGGYPGGAQFLHSSATSWYLNSIADPNQPIYIEKCPPPSTSCENGTIRHDSELDNAYGPLLRSLPFATSGLYNYSYNPDVTLENGPSAAASAIQLETWKGQPLEQIKGVATFTRADDYFTTRTQLSFDPIPTPSNNARIGSSTLDKEIAKQDAAARWDGYAFPNPFEATFSFEYTLEKAGAVLIQVYDMTGHLIATPTVETQQSKGNHRLEIDGSAWKQGLYTILLTKPDGSVVSHRVSKQ